MSEQSDQAEKDMVLIIFDILIQFPPKPPAGILP